MAIGNDNIDSFEFQAAPNIARQVTASRLNAMLQEIRSNRIVSVTGLSLKKVKGSGITLSLPPAPIVAAAPVPGPNWIAEFIALLAQVATLAAQVAEITASLAANILSGILSFFESQGISDVAAWIAGLAATATDVTTLQTQMTTANAAIATLTTEVATLTTEVATLTTEVAALLAWQAAFVAQHVIQPADGHDITIKVPGDPGNAPVDNGIPTALQNFWLTQTEDGPTETECATYLWNPH